MRSALCRPNAHFSQRFNLEIAHPKCARGLLTCCKCGAFYAFHHWRNANSQMFSLSLNIPRNDLFLQFGEIETDARMPLLGLRIKLQHGSRGNSRPSGRSRPQPIIFAQSITQASVSSTALCGHARQHRHGRIHIVVDYDIRLSLMQTMKAADILRERALP